MQNKWNGGLKDHNQNPLMSNQQKFTNVTTRWGIISNGKSIENEKQLTKIKEKRREKGPTEWELKMWPCTIAAPTWRRGLKKGETGQKEKRRQTAYNALVGPKERKRRKRNGRMEKEKREEKKDLKDRCKTILWMTPTEPLASFDRFWISSLMLD